MRLFGVIAVMIVIIAGAAYLFLFETSTRTIYIGNTQVEAKVVDDQVERQQGLSNTPSLKEGEGMLFVYDTPSKLGIWMKDMNYSIDIIWIDQLKRIVFIEENISPDTFPETFAPPDPALYVLEVPAGFVEKHGVMVGEEVTF